ncbi:non-canonical purine NTP pyrophosphatase [Candidatus Woesearchaeota archaeon]|nr:non-canonical purine NTP pyrophosphatase [Candidatus Woesearchaeota archaeon]
MSGFVLLTGNEEKIKDFENALEGSGLEFTVMKGEKPELRSDEPCEIAKTAAKALCERLKKSVVVEDSGLFIEALKDYPGTCTAYIFKRLGLNGILKLMKGIRNRKARYKSAVGYCEPGKEPLCFYGEEEGSIAESIRGSGGWGHDPIFIPKRKSKTYGELKKAGEVNLFRKKAILKLARFLNSRLAKW